jgi:hypothetical protein
VAAFHKHGNETLGSIKKSKLLFDKLSDYQLCKEYPAPWSEGVSEYVSIRRAFNCMIQALKTSTWPDV